MGRAILKLIDTYGRESLQSFKTKNYDSAKRIADKRPNCTGFDFYEDNDRIAKQMKKAMSPKKMSLSEMEQIIKGM